MIHPSPRRFLSRLSPTAAALLREAMGHRWRARGYLALLVFGAALATSKFLLLNRLLEASLRGPAGWVGVLLALTVAAWLAGELILYSATVLGSEFERRVSVEVVTRTLSSMLERSATSLRPVEANQAFHYLRRGLTLLPRALRATLGAITQCVLAGSALAVAFWLQPVLAGTTLLAGVAAVAVAARHLGRQRDGAARATAGESLFHQLLCRLLEALPQIRLYGAGEAQLDRLAAPLQERRRGEQAMLLAQRRAGLEMNLASVGTCLVLLAVGYWLVQRGTATVADLTTFLILQQSIFTALRQLLVSWSGAEEHSQFLSDFLLAPPRKQPAPGQEPGRPVAPAIHSVEVTDGVVAVGDKEVLRGVNCRLERGRLYGVCGPCGSGKTLLLHLLAGTFTPHTGRVVINDGVERPADPGRGVALLTWPPLVQPGTLADNLRLARPDATDDDLREALRRVAFDADLARLAPVGGLNAPLGRGGVRLSVGQLQRMALARALLLAPDVLLVDDLLTGLDPASAAGVLAALAEFARDRIVAVVLPVEHALGRCDELLVTSHGRLVAQGTPRVILDTPELARLLGAPRAA